MKEVRNSNLPEEKKIFRQGINEGIDPGAVAIAKPKQISPAHGLTEGMTSCKQSHPAGL